MSQRVTQMPEPLTPTEAARREIEIAIRCLSLQVPRAIYDDIWRKWQTYVTACVPQDLEFHEPQPVPVPDSVPVSICVVCTEKVRRVEGGWEHFGADQPWEPMTIGGDPDA